MRALLPRDHGDIERRPRDHLQALVREGQDPRCELPRSLPQTLNLMAPRSLFILFRVLDLFLIAIFSWFDGFQEGIRLLNSWLEGERSISFCRLLGQNTGRIKPNEIPHGELAFLWFLDDN